VALALGANSCLPDENYEPCGYPESIQQGCEKSGVNCVIEHPTCTEGYCVTWQGSDSFCSSSCKDSGDCPERGCCVTMLVGCEDPTDVSTCPSYCIERSRIKGGVCPTATSQLPSGSTEEDAAVLPEADMGTNPQ